MAIEAELVFNGFNQCFAEEKSCQFHVFHSFNIRSQNIPMLLKLTLRLSQSSSVELGSIQFVNSFEKLFCNFVRKTISWENVNGFIFLNLFNLSNIYVISLVPWLELAETLYEVVEKVKIKVELRNVSGFSDHRWGSSLHVSVHA